ncbi:peptidoglycan editing factor PgeF [Erythrobacter arachoides]|uniref:Purine nucleoside phosphorylase n=1 Tax=Aurantiacibacter arachoides TaxID=1850444 RepID=A0A845A2H0_9SPHN|nr:peptidoglycan editing factor PgeF [Aurantiacibacter arachoides]MXO94731.1 peptidoglycan editing factor PgeF [Aurantiacibacter arachoides]GGD61097.1 laccase domain protein [Aurantiacibacter arachoides]
MADAPRDPTHRQDEREAIRARVLEGIPHGFLTGPGGTGEPDPANIAPGAGLALVKQVHSARVVTVEEPCAPDARPEADALVTATPGLVLGVVTADCAPVLFADRAAGVVGAAHAGWRGAHHGVLEATVEAMEQLGARRSSIVAAIGPTIAQASYEVGQDFIDQFAAPQHRFFVPADAAGKWRFDLPGYVGWRLESLGLAATEDLALDTYADPVRFHSYRRATHRREASDGRQYSLIALSA